jgi:23S rRNA pseudouridine1911/1915/1917 synthase
VPATEWGWRIDPDELESWILRNDEDLLVVNKPGLVVCHPSKHGPWSSLVGAAREYLGVDRLHMPSRLDRETSGVVVFVKKPELASILQTAIQHRAVTKSYVAFLQGNLQDPIVVDQPIGNDEGSLVRIRQWVMAEGAPSATEFEPIRTNGEFTFVKVRPRTGRLHQIRVHASWLGHPVVGDKIYGPDQKLFVEFVEEGFTRNLARHLPLRRQALHASRIDYILESGNISFEAPLAPDLAEFHRQQFGINP